MGRFGSTVGRLDNSGAGVLPLGIWGGETDKKKGDFWEFFPNVRPAMRLMRNAYSSICMMTGLGWVNNDDEDGDFFQGHFFPH